MRTASSIENRLLTCIAVVAMFATSGAAEITPAGLPQNAALVYYQACLFRTHMYPPEAFTPVSSSFDPRFDPNKVVRSFVKLGDCQFLIELITAASNLQQCDWGTVRTAWLSAPFDMAAGQVRGLTSFLIVQAKVSACDGQYKAALENALTLRRIGRHFGSGTSVMQGESQGLDATAFDLIRYVLGKMPPDAETLTWLEKELGAGGEWKPRWRDNLMKWLDWRVQCWQASPESLARAVKDPVLKTEGLTAPQVLERARLGWNEVFKSVLEITASDKSPDDKYQELERLEFEASTRVKDGDPMGLMRYSLGDITVYRGEINCLARIHVAQAGIAIYQIKATTGQLPQALPAGLPKDPYSDKDFEYQATEKGFVLRCRAKLTVRGEDTEPKQFEFPVVEKAAASVAGQGG